jgi:2',3'-cyclic-nucleotide 2'-phosphodiesterase (5'-nucleotidase family)
MQAHKYIFNFGLVLALACCTPKVHIEKTELSHQSFANAAIDSSAYKIIFPYKEKMDKEMNEVLCISDVALTKDLPEGNLGNFVSDCILKKAADKLGPEGEKINMVLLNNGGLRASLPKGEITKGKIFELMPFDNELVLIELNGKKMQDMLVFISEKGGMPVAGIRMEINANKKPVNVKINGSDLDTNKTYNVISSDYLAEGGDNMDFFKSAGKKKYLKLLIRDALIDYCRELKQENKTIFAQTDGRITFSK